MRNEMQGTFHKITFMILFVFVVPDLLARPLTQDLIRQLQLADKALKVKSTKDCGKYYVIGEKEVLELGCPADEGAKEGAFWSFSGTHHYPTHRKFPWTKKIVAEEPDYKTKEARTFIRLPDGLEATQKNTEKVIDHLFNQELRERVKKRFDQETKIARSMKDEQLLEYVQTTEKLLFEDFKDKPRKQILTFLTLYPDLITEIEQEAGSDLRPLLCLYELSKHRWKVAKRWSNIFLVVALALGVTSLVIGTMGAAIPALAISAGVAACLLAGKDMVFALKDIGVKEKSGEIARNIKNIAYTIKETADNLEKKKGKDGLSVEEEALLGVLKDIEQDISKGRRKKLKKIERAKHLNRMMIAFAILNAGFNSVNFGGDPQLLSKLPGMLLNLLKGG